MATLNELILELTTITKRPNLQAHMARQINKVCQSISLMHYFMQDRKEISFTIDPVGATAFSVPYSVFATDIRKIDYIQVAGTTTFLTKVDPKQVFCEGRSRTDVYYCTADAVYVQLASSAVSLVIGYYQYPERLVNVSDSNWLTRMYPEVVLDGAAAAIFRMIGDDTSSRMYEEDYRLAKVQLTSDLKHGEL